MHKIILTGIKPSGRPHVANYVGMMKPALTIMREHPDWTFLYFIADYHALTVVKDAGEFRRLCRETAAAWLAMGLDPGKAVFYRQSDVPEVFELNWLLACVTPKGLMNRAHAYKAALAENRARDAQDDDAGINMGLYNYPVLMAADILLFQSDIVPVGQDQVQHVEITRDVAAAFNAVYGETLKLPVHQVKESVATIPGLDGRKMSKSYGNTIPLFVPRDELRELIFRIQTDSSPADAPKDPQTSPIFQIYREIAPPDRARALRTRYEQGIGWAEAKEELFRALDALLKVPRGIYEELMADPERVERLLAQGAERARAMAGPVLERVRRTVGRG